MTLYYADDFVTIHHGDVLDVLPALEPADLGFADPPYNFGVQYDGYTDELDPAEYAAWCAEWFAALRDRTSKTIVTPGHGNLPLWWDIAKPSGVGCWYKPGGTGSSHLGWCEWEPWLYWGQRLGGGDVVKATLSAQRGVGGHPCPKPVGLLKGLLNKTSAETVIDPFMGSGTTLVAAKALGLRAVGIEQSERYCEVAASRLTQEVLAL